MAEIDLNKLSEPFKPSDIEWRIQQSGKSGGRIWARIIPYINARAIMERLDTVCGPANWQDDYKSGPNGGTLCGISIRIDGEWVVKWDGAANTTVKEDGKLDDDTNIKGGLSASFKRAGVKWGIGRYLYSLEAAYADIVKKEEGGSYAKYRGKNGEQDEVFYWLPPALPVWALPKGPKADTKPAADTHQKADNSQPAPAPEKATNAPAGQPPAPEDPFGDPPPDTQGSEFARVKTALIDYDNKGYFPEGSSISRTIAMAMERKDLVKMKSALKWAQDQEAGNVSA